MEGTGGRGMNSRSRNSAGNSTKAMAMVALWCFALTMRGTDAFVVGRQPLQQPLRQQQQHEQKQKQKQHINELFTPTALRSSDGNGGNSMDDIGKLTSALSRLDQQWALVQQSKQTKSRWSKLVLPPDDDDDDDKAADTTADKESAQQQQQQPGAFDPSSMAPKTEDFVWLLEPPSTSIPSCTIVFTGGAGFGQFPHIAYSQFLTRLSNRLNAAVIAAPYSVGLDHFQLSKQTGESIRRALLYCQQSKESPIFLQDSVPTFSLAHSLGCKLQTIYVAATGLPLDGIGFVSYNNFSFAQTIQMARSFAQQQEQPGMNTDVINQLFQFAEMAVGAIGVDFTPSSQETQRLISLKYDAELQQKTRLFVLDDDELDSSPEFVESCAQNAAGLSLSGLPGGHLSPVYFRLDLDELGLDDPNIPPEAREMAKEAAGGIQSLSYGDEANLDELVDEVCGWVLGKEPSRSPAWDSPGRGGRVPRIAGSSVPNS